jgi:erythromycin esterase-like protein
VLSERELALVERFVEDALLAEQMMALVRTEGPERAYLRDRAMAETLRWLLDVRYPDRKIIVWAATAHFIRNSDRIENEAHPDYYAVPYQAGDHLHPVLGDDLYTVAFTAYGGEVGDAFPEGSGMETRTRALDDAPAGSFEAAAHALGEPYLFVDLRHAPAGHWLRAPFVSVALGRLVNEAPWHAVVDAFFFIDRAEPNRHVR